MVRTTRAFWMVLGYVLLALGNAPARSSTATLLDAPTNFQGTATSISSITWSWNPATGATILSQVLHDESHQVIAVLSSAATSYEETDLSENTQYTRHVHAIGLSETSPPSNSTARYTLVHDPTTGDFTVTPSSSSAIDIDVTPPPNALADLTGVYIFRTVPTGKDISGFAPVYSATDTGLQPETQYCYNIQFRNGDGILTAFGPSPLCAVTPGQDACVEQTAFKASVTYRISGHCDMQRPAAGGTKDQIQYTWAASKKSNFATSKDRKICCKDTIIEAFAGPDVPAGGDFDAEAKGDLTGLAAGVDTGPTKSRIALAFAVVVSCCERFSFTNVITKARFNIFRPDGTIVRIKGKNTEGGNATVDSVFIWPRVSVLATKPINGKPVPISGVFWDNPGFQNVGPMGQLIPGLKAGKTDTSIVPGSVINDETDFLTAVYCDEDENEATIPSRKGAETLCAVVQWGYKAQVLVGANPAANTGKVFAKPVKIICGPAAGQPPSAEFTEAKTLLDKAFNDAGALSTLDFDNKSWEFRE